MTQNDDGLIVVAASIAWLVFLVLGAILGTKFGKALKDIAWDILDAIGDWKNDR